MLFFFGPTINLLKKIILVVIVYFLVISLFSHFILKDKIALASRTSQIEQNRIDIYKTINDKNLQKTVTGRVTISIYKSLNCSLIGEACTNNPADGDKNYGKSFLGSIGNLIVLPYANPPASGVFWAYSGLQNSGFIPKTMAAEGIGMASILPFAKIWTIFRDVTYLLLVVILIAIGFMVMFRTKINPQTVISVENSLPRIIIALILITFSFAIAGFMIDLMYVLIAVIISILSPIYQFGGGSGAPQNAAQLQQYYLTASPGAIYAGTGKLNDNLTIMWQLPDAILRLIPSLNIIIRAVGGFALTYFALPIISGLVNFVKDPFGFSSLLGSLDVDVAPAGIGLRAKISQILNAAGAPVTIFILIVSILFLSTVGVNLILGLIIWFSLLFVVFRITFMLFSSYIKVLLAIILAPLYLLFEAIPGQSAFTNWLKNLTGELITFPVVVGIFVLGAIISDSATSGNLVQFPFMSGIDSKSFGFIIGMAILFMTPDLVTAVRQIFIPKPGVLDQAGPGVFFAGATTGVSGGLGELSKVAGIGFYIAPVRNLLSSLPFGKEIFGNPQQGHAPPV